jgi:hypothetical protein
MFIQNWNYYLAIQQLQKLSVEDFSLEKQTPIYRNPCNLYR